MLAEERMTVDERRKYLWRMQKRYTLAGRLGRGKLLDEMQQVLGMHRKSLIRLLNAPTLTRQPRRKQRGREYGAQVDDAIRVIAESLDYICAERLTPILPEMAEHLRRFGEMRGSPELVGQLEHISVATVGRLLRRIRQDSYRLPRKGPERANQVAKDIPMGRIAWDEAEPGHFEVDLVHHGGEVGVGEYVHTLQMVDVATGWSERVAVLGRSQREMEAGFERIKVRVPMAIVELHPDNGSEFLNNHLVRCWREAAKGLKLSRSRPYEKNDNRFVEQKNASLVRAYLGKVRLEGTFMCGKLNELYEEMWLYYNFFQPVMRLEEKRVLVREDGTRCVKHRYGCAQTPLERLCKSDAMSEQAKERLLELRKKTNPRQLRRQIYQLLDDILRRADRTACVVAEELAG